MTDLSLAKYCPDCKQTKDVRDFYVRSGITHPTEAGHYTTQCKVCHRKAVHTRKPIPRDVPGTPSECLAIDYLNAKGYLSVPGKAVWATDVDVVVFGHVWMEVKYAKLKRERLVWEFHFTMTPKQVRRGFLAHVVLLVCEYQDGERTFHLFDARDPVFYKDDRLKNGMNFVPGREMARKHGGNRTVMTQRMMDAARDDVGQIDRALRRLRDAAIETNAAQQKKGA